MKALILGILALSLVGCESLREGVSFHTIGTMLDGNICMFESKAAAEKDARASLAMLARPDEQRRHDNLLAMISNPMVSGPELCRANRETEGYLHHRSILDGRYE